MPYGNLNNRMRDAIAPLVKGRVVYDLGAGDCDHGRTLGLLGASRVVCLDKEDIPVVPKNVEFVHGYIHQTKVPRDLDVLFLGWPVNHPIPGILDWMASATTIIYLGHNFGGTACGFPAMFEHLLSRRLALHITDERNTLLVVEEGLDAPRDPTPEEVAAVSSEVMAWSPT